MRKHIFSSAAFLLILAVLIGAATFVVQPKNNTQAAGMHNSRANGILGEPENTIDVLVLGSSEVYCSIIPMEIWKDHGITSYVCGTNGQRLYQAEEFLRDALKTQKPKIVVLETLALYDRYGQTEALPEMAEAWLPILRYHDRWKNLGAVDWYQPVRYTHVQADKGYQLYREHDAADTAGYMEPTEIATPIPATNIRYLENMRRLCQKSGAQLVLLSTPSTINWNGRWHNGTVAQAEKMGIVYLDLNCMQQEVPIDWEVDTRDKGDHMNYTGAKKVTAFLGQWLEETGLFEDKRSQEAYGQWNRFLQEYLESTAADRSNDKK